MSYVYLIGNRNVGLYKIGETRSPSKRLKTNQTSCPYQLEIIHSFQSEFAYKVEKALHRDFDPFKKDEMDNTITGEWFSLSEVQVNEFLDRCKTHEETFKFLRESGNHFFHKSLKK